MPNDKKFLIRCRGIIIHDGKLLVVKHVNGNGYYVLPGGHLDWGEDVKECLSRELVEELGVKPKIGRLLYINNFTEVNRQSIEFFFEIINSHEYINLENLERTHSHELAEICWVKPSDTKIIFPKSFGEDFKEGKVLSDVIRYIKD